jgi:hypothetical protein
MFFTFIDTLPVSSDVKVDQEREVFHDVKVDDWSGVGMLRRRLPKGGGMPGS